MGRRVHWIATLGIAAVWFYHGLVPKLLLSDQSELDLWLDLGLGEATARLAVVGAGIAEVVFALLVIRFRHHRWPFLVTIAAMVGLLAAVAIMDPASLGGSYNPVGVNMAMIALAIIALTTIDEAA